MERFLNPVLVLLLLMVAILSLGIGTLDLAVGSALIDWAAQSLGGEALTREALIVGEIRLPRTLLALGMPVSYYSVPRWIESGRLSVRLVYP